MSNNIFGGEARFCERFVNRQSKNVELPDFTYIDAKLHPKYKDHIVVLSKNDFPSNQKMTYCYQSPFYDISGLDYDEKFKTHFETAVVDMEKKEEEARKEKAQQRVASAWTDEDDDDEGSYMSPLKNADQLLAESQGLGINEDSSDPSSDYEGGSSDEEEKKGVSSTSLIQSCSAWFLNLRICI